MQRLLPYKYYAIVLLTIYFSPIVWYRKEAFNDVVSVRQILWEVWMFWEVPTNSYRLMCLAIWNIHYASRINEICPMSLVHKCQQPNEVNKSRRAFIMMENFPRLIFVWKSSVCASEWETWRQRDVKMHLAFVENHCDFCVILRCRVST